MEGINELPDELLLKILSSLPRFKETVPTALISKRWRDIWKLVPDLKFDDRSIGSDIVITGLERSFVYRSLKLNNQGLERLHLKLRHNYVASTISDLVQAAVDRSVRVVRFDLFGKTLELPGCLSNCRTLKALILCNLSVEVVPHWFLLPSLKTLHLLSVKFSGDKSVASLLQICPVLEDLVVHQTQVFDINVLTLSTRGTLKTLMLRQLRIEVIPDWFCLSSLKILHLSSIKFSGKQSVASLLQICPVLERLVVDQSKKVFNICVPTLSTCRTLKTLILREISIEVVPQWFRLPSLKTLHLLSVKFSGDQSVASVLKMCPILECLVVSETKNDNVMISNIDVPTLRSLSVRNLSIDNWKEIHGKSTYVAESHGFVIKAPSLTELNFEDTISNFLKFEPMPEVIKANIEVVCDQSENFIGSLTSIQHLSLCSLTSRTPYPRETSFSSLKHLELCTCSAEWANLLVCMLNDAPEVRSLKLKSKHCANYKDLMNLWKGPTVVPKCLSKHLEILEWRQYEGTEQERNVAKYILANATYLKMATFSTRCKKKYCRMLRKIKPMDRKSKTCKLVFH